MLHNDKGVYPTEGYTIYKYVCTQHRSTKYIKQILTNLKGEMGSSIIIVGHFNTPLTSMDRSP